LLSIENPELLGVDMGRNSYLMPKIRRSFEHTYQLLTTALSSSSIKNKNGIEIDSFLSYVIRSDDKVLQTRLRNVFEINNFGNFDSSVNSCKFINNINNDNSFNIEKQLELVNNTRSNSNSNDNNSTSSISNKKIKKSSKLTNNNELKSIDKVIANNIKYKVVCGDDIAIRKSPSKNSDKTGIVMKNNSIFEAISTLVIDSIKYAKINDGWIPERIGEVIILELVKVEEHKEKENYSITQTKDNKKKRNRNSNSKNKSNKKNNLDLESGEEYSPRNSSPSDGDY
jgi:hypothetical protein